MNAIWWYPWVSCLMANLITFAGKPISLLHICMWQTWMQTNTIVFYIGRPSIICPIALSDVIFWNNELVKRWTKQSTIFLWFILISFLKNSRKIKNVQKIVLDWYVEQIIVNSILSFLYFYLHECLVGNLKVVRDTGSFFNKRACPAHCETSSIPRALQKILVTFCSQFQNVILGYNINPSKNYHVKAFQRALYFSFHT